MGDCDCCGATNVDLPYHHDNHNPPFDGYDYCQACWDWGCDGPGWCSAPPRTPVAKRPDPTLDQDVDAAIRSIQEALGG